MKTFNEQGLDFCSNFFRTLFEWNGYWWTSSEAAYQACKDGKDDWESWSKLSPSQSKYKGQRVVLRPDWEGVKIGFMEDILRAKFADPELSQLLKGTGDIELVEWNWWHDTFWGKYISTGEGQNNLGKLLMKIRNDKNIL